MTLPAAFAPALPTVAAILASMAIVAVVEAAIPLHARTRSNRTHLAPNLALTFLTFATNFFLNAGLVASLFWMNARGFGILAALGLPPLAAGAIAVVLLDFSFYVAHVAMHKIPAFWRFHRVHHSDPALDVTTSIRQHPLEGLIRYAFMGAFAIALAPSPAAFAVYRTASALNGLLEHANVRCPLWLDRALSWITTWPHMHKIHHSRKPAETDSNYSNLFSIWDRVFGTYTPSKLGVSVEYGLEGMDDPETQSTKGLLALPFRPLAGVSRLAGASFSGASSEGSLRVQPGQR